jgi:hypothetical protein
MSESLPPFTPAAAGNALASVSSAISELDAHGHDPAQYDWVPVLRKRRSDGWSPAVQRRFIEVLADSGSVANAAQVVHMSESSCYQLRRAPGAESFAAAWAAAIEEASKRLLDAAFERALVGSDEPVFDREGQRVGRRFRQSDRMLMFLMRAYMPERFGNVGPGKGGPAMPLPAPEPVAKALELLLPEPPAAPEQLMSPGYLETALQVADLMNGEVPRWRQDHDTDAEIARMMHPMPMGEEFERRLEDGKREGKGRPPLSDAEWASHRAMLLG